MGVVLSHNGAKEYSDQVTTTFRCLRERVVSHFEQIRSRVCISVLLLCLCRGIACRDM